MTYSTTSFDPDIESTEQTLEQVESLLKRAKARGSEAVEDTADLVRRHPGKALAVSVLLGAAVGALIISRFSSEPEDFSERFNGMSAETWGNVRKGAQQALAAGREAFDVLLKKFK